MEEQSHISRQSGRQAENREIVIGKVQIHDHRQNGECSNAVPTAKKTHLYYSNGATKFVYFPLINFGESGDISPDPDYF